MKKLLALFLAVFAVCLVFADEAKPKYVFLFIGDGVPVHREAISSYFGEKAVFAPAFRSYLRPSAAGWIALNRGKETDYLSLQATYLRPPNAQKNKKLLEAMGHE